MTSGFLPGLEPPRGELEMRSPCRSCGGLTGSVREKNGQRVVYCDCGTYAYCQPKSEAEASDRSRQLGNRVVDRHQRRLRRLQERCQSPIERELCAELAPLLDTLEAQVALVGDNERFVVDFALRDQRLAIECDGHTYHRANVAQVEYDYRRDRALKRAGWDVLRFSAREIRRDCAAVAPEVVRYARARGLAASSGEPRGRA